jgi:hypothetical protein
MPTPVEVSHIKRSVVNSSGIEGLGGMWRDRPWYMSERSLIWEIEWPDDRRQWSFYVQSGDKRLPVIVSSSDGRIPHDGRRPPRALEAAGLAQERGVRSIPS